MAKKIVSANDAVIRKILNDPRNEIAGKVTYQTAEGVNEYTPTVNVPKTDAGIQKILDNPTNEIAGSVAYDKGNTRYKYTPDYTAPATPTYTKSGGNGTSPDYAANMDALAKMGDWDAVYQQGNERIAKIAQSGGYDNGVNTYDYINQLIERYPEEYQKYQKNKERQKLVDLVGKDIGTQYDNLYQSLLSQYSGYNYDKFLKSNQYRTMQNLYELAGQKAMKDTLGEISARTGGYSSSYAEAAAQEQYQQYMAQLAKLANEKYDAERQGMRQDISLLGDRIDTERNWKRQLGLNEYNALMQFANEDRADKQRAEDLARQDEKEAVARQEQKEQMAKAEARSAVIAALTDPMGSHMIEDIDPDLITMSGMSWAELVAAANQGRQAQDEIAWQNEQRDMTRQQFKKSMSGGTKKASNKSSKKVNKKSESYTYDELIAYLDEAEEAGTDFATVESAVQDLYEQGLISEDLRDEVMIYAQQRLKKDTPKANTFKVPESRKTK